MSFKWESKKKREEEKNRYKKIVRSINRTNVSFLSSLYLKTFVVAYARTRHVVLEETKNKKKRKKTKGTISFSTFKTKQKKK